MAEPVAMVEVWRGDFIEAVHFGHAVVCDTSGQIVAAWGDPDKLILPRSAVKMIQALPLVESGAADQAGLSDAHLALACASHIAAPVHTDMVTVWLDQLGLGDDDLACGPQMPRDREVRDALFKAGNPVCRIHNNCSDKHTGMLTLGRHLRADMDYVRPDHPVQLAIREAFEDVTGAPSPGFAIDGCSAPNFAATLTGLARAMAFFAGARENGGRREQAAIRLHRAMTAHPHMVNGEGQSCTELMRAAGGKVAVKGGAEGSYAAILPEAGLGVVLKIADGARRAQQAAMAALLVHLGAIDQDHPAAIRWATPVQKDFAGQDVGRLRPAPGFPA